ncbi:MAG: hypothetical protein MI743_09105 [Sneathiellales bacterium]|nr:hypothetical protein [Sneathiellales bacterium]
MIKILRAAAAGVILSTVFVASVFAAGVDVNATSTGLAMRGFDPVSYFKSGTPKAGTVDLTAVHNGATYRFASKENKADFEENPAKYAPAYGGYCAFGTAMGVKVDGDPKLWKIVDNKLYLNLSPAVQKRWEGDVNGFITKADGTWENIKDKSPESLLN